MWCEVVGKMTRRRLVKVVTNIEVALLMYGWIDSPGRNVYFFTPFIRLLIEVIASIEIDFAKVRHVLTTVAVRRQSRPWLANSVRYSFLLLRIRSLLWSARYRLVIGFAAYDKGKVRRRRREAHRRRCVYMLEWSCECRGRESKVKGLSAATSVADMVIACLDKDRNCCLDQYRKHCAYLASLKPLYVFVACCECGSRVAEPQVPCHAYTLVRARGGGRPV
jgi:hypothetical protein